MSVPVAGPGTPGNLFEGGGDTDGGVSITFAGKGHVYLKNVPQPAPEPEDPEEEPGPDIDFTGTVSFEASVDQLNWFPEGLVKIEDGTLVTSGTTSGVFRTPEVQGIYRRLRISAYTEGKIEAYFLEEW